MFVEWFMSSETYRDATKLITEVDRILEPEISKLMEGLGSIAQPAIIAVIPSIMPSGSELKFRNRYSKKDNAIDFRPVINYEKFIDADLASRTSIVVETFDALLPKIKQLELGKDKEEEVCAIIQNVMKKYVIESS